MMPFSSCRCGKGVVFLVALFGAVSGAPHTPSRTKVSGDNIVENAHAQLHRFRAAQTSGKEKNDPAAADTTLDPSNTATMTTAAFAWPSSPHSVAKLHRLASNVEDRKKSRAHLSRDTGAQLQKLRASLAHHTKVTDNHDRHRQLQTCAEGSGVTVTSSMFPLLEGCLVEMDLIDGGEVEFVGATETGVISSTLTSEDDDAEYIWGAYYGTESYELACFSLEPVTSAHPSTATWFCFDDTTEDGLVAATDTTFGVACGCDGDPTAPTPTVTATPSPDVDSPTPTVPSGSSCAEGDSFTVAISLPEADGCYLSTGSTISDELVYTQTGGGGGAEMWIYSAPISEDADAEIYWFLVYVPEITSSSGFDGELMVYCVSFEQAGTVHPADANWFCDFASSSSQTFEADDDSFTCGCSSNPTPEPTEPLPEPTPEPIEPIPEPTPEPTEPIPEPTPEPATPEPVTPTPEPTESTTPEQATPTPEPASSTPEPVSATPEPVSATPEPVSSAPEPALPSTPEPTVSTTPEQVTPTPDPVSITPEPVSTTPGPILFTPEPVLSVPEPVAATTPAPVSLTEPPVAPAPVSEAVTPIPGATPSVAPTSGPTAGSRGFPVAPGPTSTPTSISPPPALVIASETPSPTLEPIDFPDVVPAPVSDDEASPSPSPEIAPPSSTCGDSESFQIISAKLPVVQGCFQATSTSFSTPGSTSEYWSVTGEVEPESILVVALLDEDTEEEGDSTPWYVAFLSEDDDATVLYCASNEQAILVHPADATWQCDLDGTDEFSDVTDEVSFTCGCTGTPAPAPDADAAPESPTGTSPPVEPESDDGGILGRRLSSSALVAGATSGLAIALALGMGV
ncbi:unnamed protein product [Ectocarpus fasciculatus]